MVIEPTVPFLKRRWLFLLLWHRHIWLDHIIIQAYIYIYIYIYIFLRRRWFMISNMLSTVTSLHETRMSHLGMDCKSIYIHMDTIYYNNAYDFDSIPCHMQNIVYIIHDDDIYIYICTIDCDFLNCGCKAFADDSKKRVAFSFTCCAQRDFAWRFLNSSSSDNIEFERRILLMTINSSSLSLSSNMVCKSPSVRMVVSSKNGRPAVKDREDNNSWFDKS